MVVVDAIALECTILPEPWKLFLGALRLFAAILRPLDVRWLAQHVGHDERADIDPNAVVQVWVPSDGLLVDGLPAHEDVVGWLACEDEFQFALQSCAAASRRSAPGLPSLAAAAWAVIQSCR